MSFPIVSSSQLPGIGEYQIPASLRFRTESNSTVTWTPVTSTSYQKGVISCWFKRGSLNSANPMHLYQSSLNSSPYRSASIALRTDNTLYVSFSYQIAPGSGWNESLQLATSGVFRDTSSWYHLYLVWDTTQATASDRASLFINGVKVTAFSSAIYPVLNENLLIDTSGYTNFIGDTNGKGVFTQGTPFDGYLAEYNRIDGFTPSVNSFGNFDINGNWKAKKYTGSYGANGFYLNFSDASGTNKNLVSMASITAPNGGVASNTIDPDTTYFSSNMTSGSAVTMLQWDFGYEANFSSVYLGGVYFTNNATSGLELSSSIDGTNWIVRSSFNITNSGANYTTPFRVKARYVRLRMVSFGSNGQLFADQIALIVDSLGIDYSGSGNNLVTNNISLVSGITYDAMIDTPLGGGGSERGNYATLNPLDNNGIISAGNLNFAQNAAAYVSATGTIGMTSGKWVWEATILSGGAVICLGISREGTRPAGAATLNSYMYNYDGVKYTNSVGPAGYGAAYTTGDIIRFEYDADTGTLTCFKNGVSQGVLVTGLTGTHFPWVSIYSSFSVAFNFGQRPFSGIPTAGFKPLHTGNLPIPTITNSKEHFDIVTRQGVGGVGGTVSSLLFAPGMLWDATRSRVGDKDIHDSVRGASKYILSNTTGAEVNGTVYSFTSNGYTISSNDWPTSDAVVEWIWKAGTTVTNTNGSVTSQVNANPAAGFSIVKYTGNSTLTATVGHGLGVAPALIFVKELSANVSGWNGWATYHKSVGATGVLFLNATSATLTTGNAWADTAPTSSVFTIRYLEGAGVNYSSDYIAYCFAEIPGYSKIGSYTGNGSADGPFVFCGFRPRWIMIKRTDASSATGWYIYDTARDTYNYHRSGLAANSTSAEFVLNEGTGGAALDTTSNGFKIRGTYADVNASGGTHIFIAIAESPFKYSLAR